MYKDGKYSLNGKYFNDQSALPITVFHSQTSNLIWRRIMFQQGAGNNPYGSLGTLKCAECRHRRKKVYPLQLESLTIVWIRRSKARVAMHLLREQRDGRYLYQNPQSCQFTTTFARKSRLERWPQSQRFSGILRGTKPKCQLRGNSPTTFEGRWEYKYKYKYKYGEWVGGALWGGKSERYVRWDFADDHRSS